MISDAKAANVTPGSRSWFLRLAVFALAIGPLGLLGIARTLQPSDAGLGTHQQLGLPPCSMRLMLGMRCPACGMTTSWAHFTRGSWLRSIQANSGGFLLAALTACFAPIWVRWGWTGCPPPPKTQSGMIYAVIAVAGVTICDWIIRIWGFS